MIKILKGNQKGMALIEVLMVTAIAGILTGAFSSAIFSLIHHTESSNSHMTAACSIETAARCISNDGQMAQNTDLTPGAAAVNSLNLSWTDPVNGDFYEINYFLSGEELRREYSLNSVVQDTRTIARYVSSLKFCQPAGNERLFTVTITSSGGSPRVSETREYHVTLRAVD